MQRIHLTLAALVVPLGRLGDLVGRKVLYTWGFVVFVAATVVHAAISIGLYLILDLRQFGSPYAAVAGQALGNAVVGVVVFQLAELLPGAVERRRAQKARIRKNS